MGFNTCNEVECSPSDAHFHESRHGLLDRGFLDSYHAYFQVDCGWQRLERDASCAITYDDMAFPRGITPLSDPTKSLELI